MKLVVATGNQGKIDEIAALLARDGIELYSLADFPGMPEVIEDGATFLENALKKARAAASFTSLPTLADDSGLMVDALDGAPGVLSARFAPTTEERNRKLLELLVEIPERRRTARFVCALVLVRSNGFKWTTTGVCEGLITREPSGTEGFGYDPVFLYPPLGKTFAEISIADKNGISHRGRALASFREAVVNDHILG